MKRAKGFLTGVVVGALGMYGAMTYHVVRASDGLHLIPKVHPGLAEVYVDIRSFDAGDWNAHRNLAAALVKADKESLIGSASLTGLRDAAREALDAPGR